MSITDRKFLWWLVFASCAGIAFFMLVSSIFDLSLENRRPRRRADILGPLVFFCVEGTVAVVAGLKLKRYYAEEPLNWTGRWQLSLSDLLCIVFFFASAMAICREIEPTQFLSRGAPISMGLGIGYTIALLAVARMGRWTSAKERWYYAFVYLIRAIVILVLAIMSQCLAYAFVAIVFGLIFRLFRK